MTIQYYDLLQDKTKKKLLYLIDYIAPGFSIGELQILIDDSIKKSKKKQNNKDSEKISAFREIGDDFETKADLSKLTEQQLKNLYQIFISRELNDKLAVKWRFYQFFKYIRDIVIENIKINLSENFEKIIDFIIETTDHKFIFILCFDVLDNQKFKLGIENCKEFAKSNKITPDKIFFVTNKTYRDIEIANLIKIGNNELVVELWVEDNDETIPFNGEDLLIINNTKLQLAGFNFTSMEDLLDYIYEFSDGGQISIFKKPGFFSEVNKGDLEEILIWKGIMIKNEIL